MQLECKVHVGAESKVEGVAAAAGAPEPCQELQPTG